MQPSLLTRQNDPELSQISDLTQAIFDRYGVDFRAYAISSLRRRISKQMSEEGLATIPALQKLVTAYPAAMSRLLKTLTIHVTAMFRDPGFYSVFRKEAVPRLWTYPYLRFWIAGCSTGEEVYSLAILLAEEGLYERSRIYATDISDQVLEKARSGIFPVSAMQEYTRNYQRAGGTRSFAEYYTADDKYAIFPLTLRRNIIFSAHNLVGDHSFNEFHGIFCRNVMIYFNRALQDRVHRLFHQSLLTFGYLGLGRSENIKFSTHAEDYEVVSGAEKPLPQVEMIVVGGSMGGLRALNRVLRDIPARFDDAIAVVLHRHKDSDGTLLEMVKRESPLPASEPSDKEPILAGRVYLAPADYHLLIEPSQFSLSIDDPVRFARPSIDVLFESAAQAYGSRAIGLVLTGANHDGTEGAAKIKERGGRVIIQDPATAEAPQMPQGVIACIAPDYVLSLEEVGPLLVALTTRPS